MTFTTTARIAVVGLGGLLAFTACGGSSSSSESSAGAASGGASASSAINCAQGTIKASGSSAQKNAITEWINNYQQACSGATIEYAPSGSGAGVTDFINAQTAFAGSDSALNTDQATQAAEFAVDALEHRDHLGLFGHIRLHGERVPAQRAHLGGQGLGRSGIAGVVDRHVPARLRGQPHGGRADAAAGASDQQHRR